MVGLPLGVPPPPPILKGDGEEEREGLRKGVVEVEREGEEVAELLPPPTVRVALEVRDADTEGVLEGERV